MELLSLPPRRIIKPLVTGGAGFIGSHLVEALMEHGVENITILDNSSKRILENLGAAIEKIKVIEADITNLDWNDILRQSDCDAVFHFAGNAEVQSSVEQPDSDYQLNLQPTFRLLETLRKTAWPGILVFASSAAVYGNPMRLPIQETDATVPLSPYGASKLASERYISVYSRLYGIKAASMRSFSVFGPRLRKQVVYDFFKKMSDNPREITIHGDGTQTRDFIYVQDVVRAAIAIAEHGTLTGETYNVATGQSHSILQLAEAIAQELGLDPRFVFTGKARKGDPDKWEVDVQKLMGLGFRPRFDLRLGLSKTKEWLLAEHGR